MSKGEMAVPIPKAIPKSAPDNIVLEIKAISNNKPTRGAQGKIPIVNPKISIPNGVFSINFSFKIWQTLNFGSLPKIIRRDIIITNIEKKVFRYTCKFPVKLFNNLIEIVANIAKNTYPIVREIENIKISTNADFQLSFVEAK